MTLPEVVYRCTWDTGWSQYHDASDPMPAKWDDKPPDFVEAFVSKIDAESRLAAADAEIERLRESHRKLHRRCQEAEAALPDYRKLTALPPDGDGVRFVSGNMGRALLVSECNKLQEELHAGTEAGWHALRNERDDLKSRLAAADALLVSIAAYAPPEHEYLHGCPVDMCEACKLYGYLQSSDAKREARE